MKDWLFGYVIQLDWSVKFSLLLQVYPRLVYFAVK
jgi:hypothetical protein